MIKTLFFITFWCHISNAVRIVEKIVFAYIYVCFSLLFQYCGSCYMGLELLKSGSENILKSLWNHSDAIMCCSLKVSFVYKLLEKLPFQKLNKIIDDIIFFVQALPVFTFANQAGLDMLETTLVALQDISLEKVLDEHGRKGLFTEFAQIMQQVC